MLQLNEFELKLGEKYKTGNQVKDIFDVWSHEYKNKIVDELEKKIVKSVEEFSKHVSESAQLLEYVRKVI